MYIYYPPKCCNSYPRQMNLRGSDKEENRGLLLPLLFGAAVGFPLGYITSNTKNQGYGYPMPQPYMQPYPAPYPQYPVAPMPMYY